MALSTFFAATESSKQQTASVAATLLRVALTSHLILDQPEVFHPKTETYCRPILALGTGEFGETIGVNNRVIPVSILEDLIPLPIPRIDRCAARDSMNWGRAVCPAK